MYERMMERSVLKTVFSFSTSCICTFSSFCFMLLYCFSPLKSLRFAPTL